MAFLPENAVLFSLVLTTHTTSLNIKRLPFITEMQFILPVMWSHLLFPLPATGTARYFLISNFRRVLYVVRFLLGNSDAGELPKRKHTTARSLLSGFS
jgi:hypothetical protein